MERQEELSSSRNEVGKNIGRVGFNRYMEDNEIPD